MSTTKWSFRLRLTGQSHCIHDESGHILATKRSTELAIESSSDVHPPAPKSLRHANGPWRRVRSFLVEAYAKVASG